MFVKLIVQFVVNMLCKLIVQVMCSYIDYHTRYMFAKVANDSHVISAPANVTIDRFNMATGTEDQSLVRYISGRLGPVATFSEPHIARRVTLLIGDGECMYF